LAGSRRCGAADVEHGLELAVGHLVDDAVPGIAGVVDQDVELAEAVDRRLDELLGHPVRGQVAREQRGLTVDLRGRLLGALGVEVVDEHARAVLGQELRRRPADAARRPGDDRGLAVQNAHAPPVYGVYQAT
jgi:hypothetical protein